VKLCIGGEYDKLFRDGEYENFCIVGVLTPLTTSPPIPETIFFNSMGAYSSSVPKTFYPIIYINAIDNYYFLSQGQTQRKK
jgi:hypothetical protein